MRILVTYPDVPLRDVLYPDDVVDRLESLGEVEWNETNEQFTPEEFRERIQGVDVCVTGWGCPTVSEAVVEAADSLELVAHVGGSVAWVVTPAVYERDIDVCSANHVMAPFVSEGILAYVLSALRDVPGFDGAMKAGDWPDDSTHTSSLFEASVGFVGLGAVGRHLLELLEPFDVTVDVYDPYVSDADVADYDTVTLTDLDRTLEGADVVSIHASLTPETVGLLDAEALARLPDGCLLVNAARGAIVDEDALLAELETDRISAAIDVYETEPLPTDHPFRDQDNALLGPHVAGSPTRTEMARAVVEEIERFAAGDPLEHTIPRERYELMTRDRLEI